MKGQDADKQFLQKLKPYPVLPESDCTSPKNKDYTSTVIDKRSKKSAVMFGLGNIFWTSPTRGDRTGQLHVRESVHVRRAISGCVRRGCMEGDEVRGSVKPVGPLKSPRFPFRLTYKIARFCESECNFRYVPIEKYNAHRIKVRGSKPMQWFDHFILLFRRTLENQPCWIATHAPTSPATNYAIPSALILGPTLLL